MLSHRAPAPTADRRTRSSRRAARRRRRAPRAPRAIRSARTPPRAPPAAWRRSRRAPSAPPAPQAIASCALSPAPRWHPTESYATTTPRTFLLDKVIGGLPVLWRRPRGRTTELPALRRAGRIVARRLRIARERPAPPARFVVVRPRHRRARRPLRDPRHPRRRAARHRLPRVRPRDRGRRRGEGPPQ